MAMALVGLSRPSHGPRGRRTAVRVLRSLCLAFLVLGSTTAAQAAEPAASGDPREPDYALIEEALDVILERFVDEDALTRENLTRGAIRGIVEALGDDGHTVFLTPEELQAEQDALDGRVSGVGLVIDQRSGSPLVISVVDGSPADRAGVRSGDLIVSVDGEDTSRLAPDALADRVRGAVDTTVHLGIERPGTPAILDMRIVRADIEIEPASWALVPGSNVAVVRIVQFSAQSGAVTREAIEEALEAGAEGIVLDLRGNPGGLVDEALVVAGSFLEEGVAYQEQGRDGPPTDVPIRSGFTIAPDVPLALLVDYGTASSAEILAAALRDNGRATIVGVQTYGTGTVLNTFDLSDGSAVRVGVLAWLTPSGDGVFRVGITPDVKIELPLGAVALAPGDLVGMTAADLERSDDLPLLEAVRLVS